MAAVSCLKQFKVYYECIKAINSTADKELQGIGLSILENRLQPLRGRSTTTSGL